MYIFVFSGVPSGRPLLLSAYTGRSNPPLRKFSTCRFHVLSRNITRERIESHHHLRVAEKKKTSSSEAGGQRTSVEGCRGRRGRRAEGRDGSSDGGEPRSVYLLSCGVMDFEVTFGRAFILLLHNWERVHTFLRVAELGMPHAQRTLREEFDKRLSAPDGLSERVIEAMKQVDSAYHAEAQVNDAQAAVDAAALIFTHSVVDDAAMKCCRLIALASQRAGLRHLVRRSARKAPQ